MVISLTETLHAMLFLLTMILESLAFKAQGLQDTAEQEALGRSTGLVLLLPGGACRRVGSWWLPTQGSSAPIWGESAPSMWVRRNLSRKFWKEQFMVQDTISKQSKPFVAFSSTWKYLTLALEELENLHKHAELGAMLMWNDDSGKSRRCTLHLEEVE